MRWSYVGRALLASSLFFLCAALTALGDPRDDFARETGLDADLIGIIQVDVGGTEMTIAFVFVNERALASRVSPTLRQALEPYVGRNALYVNPSVRGVVPSFGFDPQALAVQGEGRERTTPPASAWVEITPGFLTGTFQVNPAGATQGSGSEGIVVLGDAIDSAVPMTVYYGAASTTFDIASDAAPAAGSTGSTSALSHEPITVPALEDVTSLEEVLALPDLTADALALLFGLDPSLVRLLDVTVKSDTIRMVFVRLEESVRASELGRELLGRLDSVIGTGAVMVWGWSSAAASFFPWWFYIQQSGTNYVFFSDASFVELTAGFLDLTRLVPGQLAAAVIRLPKSVHPLEPFGVRYSTFGVTYP
jgi:hypothetical protein